MTVRHLRINGTNFEIGHKLAELALERYGQSPDDYAADPLFTGARRDYFRRHYPIHWERMLGAYAAFGLDPQDDRFDLSGLWYNLDVPPPPAG